MKPKIINKHKKQNIRQGKKISQLMFISNTERNSYERLSKKNGCSKFMERMITLWGKNTGEGVFYC
jgi:hypothetical protein